MKRKEWTILILSFILLGVLVFYYFYFSSLKIQRNSEPIGSIFYRHKVVERKDYSGFLWDSINQGEEVYRNDSIRTDEFAEAVLILKNDIRIELDPHSMIVLNWKEGRAEIELQRGIMTINSSGRDSVLIKTKNLIFTNPEGKLKLKLAGDSLEFENEKKIIISDNGNTKEISPFAYGWTSAGLEKKDYLIQLQNPKDNFRFFSKEGQAVNFDWQSNLTGNFQIEFSFYSDFREIKISKEVLANSIAIELPDGSYYWRVKKNADYSEIRRIRVYSAKPVFVLNPKENSELVVDFPTNVYFSWTLQEMAKEYKLLISNSEKMENSKEFVSNRNGISVQFEKEGKYFFRLDSISSIPEIDTSTKVLSFTLSAKNIAVKETKQTEPEKKEIATIPKTETLEIPKKEEIKNSLPKKEVQLILQYPGNGSTVDMAKLNSLQFKWTSVDKNAVYSFRLFNSNSGKSKILEKETKENKFTMADLSQLDIGNFEWEVEASWNADGESKQMSKTSRFKIILSEELEKPDIN